MYKIYISSASILTSEFYNIKLRKKTKLLHANREFGLRYIENLIVHQKFSSWTQIDSTIYKAF